MVLSTIFCHLIPELFLRLTTVLISNFIIIFILTILWRAYKTVLVRKVPFLRKHFLKPVESHQTVLITGASSGIGLALAKHLHKVGYAVIATYYDTKDPGYEELKRISQQTDSSSGSRRRPLFLHQLDVTSQEQVSRLYENVVADLDANKLQLYALINNAGLGSLQPFAWLQRRTFLKLIETNISGALLMTREFLPLLVKCSSSNGKNGDSRLLYVSSGLGFVPGATYATYGLTKSAQLYFSRCMNLELRKRYKVHSIAMVPHNFIKNTNICAQNVQTNQAAWDELKPIERQLYKGEHDEQLELSKSLERATREHNAKLTQQQTVTPNKPTNNQASSRKQKSSTSDQIVNFFWSSVEFIRDVIACLRGENLAQTLEESGALECFEDALRLRNPPEQIFAGDSKFQLIIGSLLLSLPNSCVGLLSNSVAPSLYR